MSTNRNRYLQICVEAADGTNGQGLKQFLWRVSIALNAGWVALSDVDLVGDARVSLLTVGHEIRVLPVSELLNLLEDVRQVVWATVFLCGSQEAAETITGAEDFVVALAKAQGLVRVVDATYYYIYGEVPSLAHLREELDGEQKEGTAHDLDFPE